MSKDSVCAKSSLTRDETASQHGYNVLDKHYPGGTIAEITRYCYGGIDEWEAVNMGDFSRESMIYRERLVAAIVS